MNTGRLEGDTGKALAHEAIDQALGKGVSVAAKNYELWLNYVGDFIPGLRQEVDAALQTATKPQETLDGLHERYFTPATPHYDQIMATGDTIADELRSAIQALKAAGVQSDRFGETLDSASNALSGPLDGTSLRGIVSDLTAATQQMAEQNQNLGHQLRQAGSEIETLRSNLEDAQRDALTDALTGVANRKRLDATLEFRLTESRSLNYPVTLAMCDIDFFKKFNDTWGHQTGDQVLRFVSATMMKLVLKDHLVARYGGEEFAIVLPRVSLDEAMPVLERIRRAIEAKQLMRKSTNQSLGSVTMSFGIATANPGDTVESLIARADACLYKSKEDGRNRITREDQLSNRVAA